MIKGGVARFWCLVLDLLGTCKGDAGMPAVLCRRVGSLTLLEITRKFDQVNELAAFSCEKNVASLCALSRRSPWGARHSKDVRIFFFPCLRVKHRCREPVFCANRPKRVLSHNRPSCFFPSCRRAYLQGV